MLIKSIQISNFGKDFKVFACCCSPIEKRADKCLEKQFHCLFPILSHRLAILCSKHLRLPRSFKGTKEEIFTERLCTWEKDKIFSSREKEGKKYLELLWADFAFLSGLNISQKLFPTKPFCLCRRQSKFPLWLLNNFRFPEGTQHNTL